MLSQAVASNLWQQKLYILLQLTKFKLLYKEYSSMIWFCRLFSCDTVPAKEIAYTVNKKNLVFLEPVEHLAKELQYLNDAAKLYCSIVSTAYFPKKNKAVIQLVYFIVSIRVGRFSIFKLNMLGVVRLC